MPFRRFSADLHKIQKVSSPRHVLDPIRIPERSGLKQRHREGKTGDFCRFLTDSARFDGRHSSTAGRIFTKLTGQLVWHVPRIVFEFQSDRSRIDVAGTLRVFFVGDFCRFFTFFARFDGGHSSAASRIFTKIAGQLILHVSRVVFEFQSDRSRNGEARIEKLGAERRPR